MLYVTTRSKIDSYTAHRALCDGFAADGGQFTPMRLPSFDEEQIDELCRRSFCGIIAEILNVFFSKKLTGWNIEFAIGRKPVKIAEIGQKMWIAEAWRNSDNNFDVSVDRIYNVLCGTGFGCKRASGWARIAIRIAFVFGFYAELSRLGIDRFDFSVAGKDFEAGISVWYARQMGLPIGVIICGCNENCGIWDLLNKQQINFNTQVINTTTPDMDDLNPAGVERLVYEYLGVEECSKYNQAFDSTTSYQLPANGMKHFGPDMFSSVIGRNRVLDTIGSVYKTAGYMINPYLAIACAAVQDYRTVNGENSVTVLWSEQSAAQYAQIISSCTGLPEKDIMNF